MESTRGGGTGPGLPRHTFTDDPFFRDSAAGDVFRDFGSPSSHRRFGSNPRIFDDDFFDNFSNGSAGFGGEPPFFRSSLPRRSPAPMFDRPTHSPNMPNMPNMQRQQTTPQRSPIPQRKADPSTQFNAQNSPPNNNYHQRQSSSGSNYDNYHQNHPQTKPQQQQYPPSTGEQQPGEKVHVIHVQHQPSTQSSNNNNSNFVEINKASPNSYTNGQLNPDKRGGFGNISGGGAKIPTVKVEDYADRSDADFPAKKHQSSSLNRSNPAISEKPIPLPAPAIAMPGPAKKDEPQTPPVDKTAEAALNNNAGEVAPVPSDVSERKADEVIAEPKKFVPLVACNEQLINLLDDTELRVDQLRETVSQLEQEKEAVLDILSNVKLNAEILQLCASEQDEVNMHADRILKRCKAVDVAVNTVRNEEQARALDDVNRLIEAVVMKMRDDVTSAKDTIERFLNACSPDEPPGPIDQRFQIKIVECAADDQKRIRRRLMQLIGQLERTQCACPQT